MLFEFITETISYSTCLFILFGAIILSIKTRFVQFRAIPKIIKILLKKKTKKSCKNTVSSKKALLTAMSSSIGMGNIVSPVIAIKLGGPGALLGFMLATIFGAAATFTEVTFALRNRKRRKDGSIKGGSMPYIKKMLGSFVAKIYAFSALIVLTVWASNQANALSDLLHAHNISKYVTGILLAITVSYVLLGGIKRVSKISARLVPLMLILYISAALWIIFNNISELPKVISLIFKSAFTPKAIFGAGTGFGIQSALRWGLAKGYFSNISGLGMSTIPHSMSSTRTPVKQGMLSMAAIYSDGIVCLLTGLMVLMTGAWLDPSHGIGINIIASVFKNYFASIGTVVILISAFLFSFGTIVGEGYMGSQCFSYAAKRKYLYIFNLAMATIIFLGSIAEVKFLAQITDIFLLPLALPNMISIIMLAFRKKKALRIKKEKVKKTRISPAVSLSVKIEKGFELPITQPQKEDKWSNSIKKNF
ncbi:amino acid carrier protein [Candidatus Dependentiae bacterium]|nr:amino acid carrier protein [Candidatus Dependentiae bacterium]